MSHHSRGSMNCSGVKYISKYIHGKTLECWIIDKMIEHIECCPDSAFNLDCGVQGTAIRDHINLCHDCNVRYRIGRKRLSALTLARTVPPVNVPDTTARLNKFRYSVPRDLNRWIPTGRR